MKGVYLVKRKHGTAVCISYTAPGERRVRELVASVKKGVNFQSELRLARRRAEMVYRKRQGEIVEGRHQLAPRRTMTLGEFVEKYYADELRERRGGGIRTAGKEIQRLTTGPVGLEFGSTRLSELTEWRIRKYVRARREAGIGPGAINRDLSRLSNLWRSAHKRKLVTGDNPLSDVGKLDEPTHRVRYLEPDEEQKLLGACNPGLRPIVEVAIHTGIRQGALLGLQWKDVQWHPTPQVHVPDTLSKNRKSYTVPMSSTVQRTLRELARRGAFTTPMDYVFCLRDGLPRRSIRTAWDTARARAGLVDLRFHDLRHTAASRIVMAGGTLYDAQEHLGQRTASMTLRYAHLSPDHRQRIAALTELPSPVTDLSRAREKREAKVGLRGRVQQP